VRVFIPQRTLTAADTKACCCVLSEPKKQSAMFKVHYLIKNHKKIKELLKNCKNKYTYLSYGRMSFNDSAPDEVSSNPKQKYYYFNPRQVKEHFHQVSRELMTINNIFLELYS
jgi:hypothetical protein